jgi:hypothetical protein
MVELADIFRIHGPAYRKKFEGRIPRRHLEVMQAIEHCRTEEMGGHLLECDVCGEREYTFHSCGDRHCPKCGNARTSEWLERQHDFLLPVPYYMVTFTLPEELRALSRSTPSILYDIMFRASSQAFKKLSLDPRFLGGEVGMLGVLQTWARDMSYHVHIHYLVPGGALSPDGASWLTPKYQHKEWMLPLRALSVIFRGKFRDMLDREGLKEHVPKRTWRKSWNVNCKPVGTGAGVIKYLAPYIMRVAISNRRIVDLHDGKVTFQVKGSNGADPALLTLDAKEFIRRFLQHVLPRGFQKVRYYGFLSSSRRDALREIREILGPLSPEDEEAAQHLDRHSIDEDTVIDAIQRLPTCRHCGGPLLVIRRLERKQRAPPSTQCTEDQL